jgi:hypothetical protein
MYTQLSGFSYMRFHLTRGMIVLPFPKYDIMLIVLVVVKPLLSQAIPVRFSEINYGLDSDSISGASLSRPRSRGGRGR